MKLGCRDAFPNDEHPVIDHVIDSYDVDRPPIKHGEEVFAAILGGGGGKPGEVFSLKKEGDPKSSVIGREGPEGGEVLGLDLWRLAKSAKGAAHGLRKSHFGPLRGVPLGVKADLIWFRFFAAALSKQRSDQEEDERESHGKRLKREGQIVKTGVATLLLELRSRAGRFTALRHTFAKITKMSTKVGIIGAGGMLRYHVDGFRAANAEIVAVADLAPGAAAKAAAEWGIDHSFSSVEEMLEQADLEAVSIIVPNKFHAPLAIQCLEAGKHVFCEKPPALSADQVTVMIEAAKAKGKELMFNFNNRARPESLAIMEKVKDGTVGTINSAQAKWARRTGVPGFGGWFTSKEQAGGGALIDLLHMVDLAMYLMGYPEPAHVLGQTFDTFTGNQNFKGPWGIPDREGGVVDVEMAAHGFVTFKTGQVLSLQVSWAEMIKREEVSVVFQGTGAGGKIERLFGKDGFDETAIDLAELYTQDGEESVDTILNIDPCEDMGRIASATNFIEALEGRAEPLNTPDQALKLMRVIDAIYASASSGKPVSL